MATQNHNSNPFPDMFQFYLSQVEKMNPVVKQAIDDWFNVYKKIWTAGLRTQNGLFKKFAGNSINDDISEQAIVLGEKMLDLQRDLSTSVMNTGMKGIKAIMEAAKKNKNAAL
jgi:hypothetical protein